MSKRQTVKRSTHDTNNNFFVMLRATAQDSNLSWEARGILCYVLSKPDNWLVIISDLRQQCGRDKACKIIKELISAGYIENRKPIRDPKTQRILEYTPYIVHESPFNKKLVAEKPLTANQETGSQDTAEPTLHNTDKQSRDKENKETTLSATADGANPDVKDSVKQVPEAEPTPPRKNKQTPELKNYVALAFFGWHDPKTITVGNWKRVTKLLNQVLAVHDVHGTLCQQTHLDYFIEWYKDKYPEAHLPLNNGMETHYATFYAERRQRVKQVSQPEERPKSFEELFGKTTLPKPTIPDETEARKYNE